MNKELDNLLIDIKGIKDTKLQNKMVQIISLIEQGKVDSDAFTTSLSNTIDAFDISEMSKELAAEVFSELVNEIFDNFLKSDITIDYTEYLESVKLDIKNRGKEALKDLLDNCVYDLTEPKLRSILLENKKLLKEIK